MIDFMPFSLKGIAQDIRFLDFQLTRYASPAIDLACCLFTSTDKAFRDVEYENLLKRYYGSLSTAMKSLGSDSKKLFTFDDLKNELKLYGYYALLLTPFYIQAMVADSSEVTNLDEQFNKMANGEGAIEIISGLSAERQREYGRRLNEVFEDIVNFGYYHKVN